MWGGVWSEKPKDLIMEISAGPEEAQKKPVIMQL